MDENLNPTTSSVVQPTPTPAPKSLRKGILLAFFICLLVLGGGLYFYTVSSQNEKSVDIAPIDDSLMRIEPFNIAPGDNAYSELIKLKGILVSASTSRVNVLARNYLDNENPSAEEVREMKNLLEKNKLAFDIFDRSILKPAYVCGLENQDCNLNDIRDVAFLKIVHADLLFKEGKTEEAMDELFVILDFGNKVKQNPSLIIYLVSMAIEKPALIRIQKIIDSGKLTVAEKTKYLNKLKTYSDDGTALKNAYKGEYNYQKKSIDRITEGTLSEDEKKDFPVEWSLINTHTWKPNQVTLWAFTLIKNNIENIDKPCGGDYSQANNALIEQIKQETLNSKITDENYVGKILFATTAASLDSVITKRCELVDLKNKIETSLAQ